MRLETRLWPFVLGVFVMLSMAAGWAYAQSIRVQPLTPTVLSGADVGFRVEGQRAGTPVGKLVVKINGEWVEAELWTGSLTRPLGTR